MSDKGFQSWHGYQAMIDDKFSLPPVDQIPSSPVWDVFEGTSTKADVLRYLLATGWDIKKSTFFEGHCASGKLKKNRAGLYTKAAVKKYAKTWLVHRGLGSTVNEAETAKADRKLQLEIDALEIKNRREQRKDDIEAGKYVERSKVEQEYAARYVVYDSGWEFFFRANIEHICLMAGGSADRAPEVLTYLLAEKNRLGTEFADTKNLELIFEGDE